MRKPRTLRSEDFTSERLRELLSYDRDTGVFTWLEVSKFGGVKVGDVAGCVNEHGYRSIGIKRRQYAANRLAILYVTGEWPKGLVDHRDFDTDNNRFDNLRDVTTKVNAENRKVSTNGATGLLGVTKKGGRYVARIRHNYELRHLGYFSTAEAAHQRYLEVKRQVHLGCTV
jgi:hypothetical protein